MVYVLKSVINCLCLNFFITGKGIIVYIFVAHTVCSGKLDFLDKLKSSMKTFRNLLLWGSSYFLIDYRNIYNRIMEVAWQL